MASHFEMRPIDLAGEGGAPHFSVRSSIVDFAVELGDPIDYNPGPLRLQPIDPTPMSDTLSAAEDRYTASNSKTT
jgi:hypothetical protein